LLFVSLNFNQGKNMLKKIYIHNFRCFENFELELDKLNLFIGANGVGKSSLFHVLHKIQNNCSVTLLIFKFCRSRFADKPFYRPMFFRWVMKKHWSINDKPGTTAP
jgi:predicted ATPase